MSITALSALDLQPEDATSQSPKRNIPLHFKLFFVGAIIYLGYRLYQGIEWLIHHL